MMVVARSLRAHTRLVEALQERDVHRQYLAVALGAMIAGGSVDAPIGRHPRDRLKRAVVDEPAGQARADALPRARAFPRTHADRMPAGDRAHPSDPRTWLTSSIRSSAMRSMAAA